MKDILVDNTVAKNFANPLDPDYQKFILWLMADGVLVVTQTLLREYFASSGGSLSNTSIPVIIDRLTRDGRLRRVQQCELRAFRIPKRIESRLRSNRSDHDSIRAVLLSVRKFAISHDTKLRHDINSYPGYGACAVRRPQDVGYAN